MESSNVFISWSGSVSHAVARYLSDWIQNVVLDAVPWVSDEDIHKGSLWLPKLQEGLQNAKAGILVLTPENAEKPWMLFEAGAIWKALPRTTCCPLLVGIEATDLSGPLASFQGTVASDELEVYKLVTAIDSAVRKDTGENAKLKRRFEKFWPDLQNELQAHSRNAPVQTKGALPPTRQESMLGEVLDTVRAIERRVAVAGDWPTHRYPLSNFAPIVNAIGFSQPHRRIRAPHFNHPLDPEDLRELVLALTHRDPPVEAHAPLLRYREAYRRKISDPLHLTPLELVSLQDDVLAAALGEEDDDIELPEGAPADKD